MLRFVVLSLFVLKVNSAIIPGFPNGIPEFPSGFDFSKLIPGRGGGGGGPEGWDGEDGEYGGHFEGDMVLDTEQKEILSGESIGNKNGLRNPATRWPDKTVIYYIQAKDFNSDQIQRINAAMSDISKNTCIRFKKRTTSSQPSVTIRGDGNGCWSHVGYTRQQQSLNLARGCFSHGTIVHEMLHTIGFFHMQSATNRDDYVRILWENIQKGQEHNFNKYDSNTVTDFGVAYDYGSVMHDSTAFSSNGKKTIVPLKDNVTLGQRAGMTQSDILKVNRMYCQ